MDVAVRAGTAAVAVASRLRGERAIHGRGRALTGRLDVTGGTATGAPLLDLPGSYEVVVRLSRSAGLPLPLPDVLGLAVRVLDAHGPGRHQDLLLDSTRPEPVLRRLPLPGRDVLGVTYCSLLPYDVQGRHLLLGARGLSGQATSMADVTEASFGLLVATPHGPWQQVGVVSTETELPAPQGRGLRFNPGVTGGGLRLAGPFQAWRQRAYPASQDVG